MCDFYDDKIEVQQLISYFINNFLLIICIGMQLRTC